MPPVSLLIKPASSSCNLRCAYCFYHDVSSKREVRNYGLMALETLETLVRRALEEAEGAVAFAFQGGEPTLAGLPFYRAFMEYVAKYDTGRVKLSFAIQTNGMLIDDEWAAFFAANNFLVGLSLDGNRDIHDLHRVDAKGKGSFQTVMHAAGCLTKHKVSFNILCVVNRMTARHIDKIYTFYKKSGFRWLQFIPCLDELGEERGQNPYSITPALYETFLKTLFDRWYADFMANDAVSIRHFDNWLSIMLGHPPESCSMNGVCASYFVVEADGSVYPCDFYVFDKWRIGNIGQDGFAAMRASAVAQRFIQESTNVQDECKACGYYQLCRGGCKRDRALLPDGAYGLNEFCAAHKAFFAYALPRMEQAAMMVGRNMRS